MSKVDITPTPTRKPDSSKWIQTTRFLQIFEPNADTSGSKPRQIKGQWPPQLGTILAYQQQGQSTTHKENAVERHTIDTLIAARSLPSPSLRLHHAEDGTWIGVVAFDPETNNPRFGFVRLPDDDALSDNPETALRKARNLEIS